MTHRLNDNASPNHWNCIEQSFNNLVKFYFFSSLFHVMVERYSHPFPNMQMFLNLAEEYQIQDVLDQINQNGEVS